MTPSVRSSFRACRGYTSAMSLLALLLWPMFAMAQDPCPQGLRQVSQECSHGYCRPVCMPDNAPASIGYDATPQYPIAPAPIYTSFWALAMWEDSEGRPHYALGAGPAFAEDADTAALARCRRVSAGAACTIVRRYNSGVFAIARGADGSLFHGLYPFPQMTNEFHLAKKATKTASKEIVGFCVAKTGGDCKLLEVVASNDWIGYDN